MRCNRFASPFPTVAFATFIILALAPVNARVAPASARQIQREMRAGRAILHPKVLIISYDPIVRSEGGKRLHEVCRWHDPEALVRGFMEDVADVSGGAVQYRIAAREDVDGFPVKMDGFRYDEQSFITCFRSGKGWHQPDAIDYAALLRGYRIAERVERGEVDEVWVMATPYSGMYESTMAGRGAYFCNSDPLPNVHCPRAFVVMGFNYERGVGEMLEDLGHRTESIMTHVYGSWEPKETHAWNRFTLYDKIAPGRAGCGNVHFAPSSQHDYDWGNPSKVLSSCDDWLRYPHLTGERRMVSCAEWGNGDIRLHHRWWLRHLPHVPGRTDGKLNDWWQYVLDFNRYPESRGA